ncbi:LOW QUALITY PROTEIN: hypothetical protein TorRG33x02_340840 [Trema orientale]|uniref:Uncharacterized protein n=1 Tax=Trema orientale TaxID=63057 RepID=A0A2P5AUP2_TREOI|nr:LOW QUALITY PROTEIN: hypothetical protein TorRG33x02_340840 [Trema orientale]
MFYRRSRAIQGLIGLLCEESSHVALVTRPDADWGCEVTRLDVKRLDEYGCRGAQSIILGNEG